MINDENNTTINGRNATGIWALVPIKARGLCKTRLSHHLSDEQRLSLVRSMLQHVLSVLQSNSRIEKVLVLSSERDEVPECVDVLADEGSELNSCLQAAMRTIQQDSQARQLLIIPADLAAVTGADINALLDATTDGAVAIAPSEDREGTNALCLPVGIAFDFSFGEKSFLRHCNACMRTGHAVEVVASHGLGFDLDTHNDFEHYEEQEKDTDKTIAGAITGATL